MFHYNTSQQFISLHKRDIEKVIQNIPELNFYTINSFNVYLQSPKRLYNRKKPKLPSEPQASTSPMKKVDVKCKYFHLTVQLLYAYRHMSLL